MHRAAARYVKALEQQGAVHVFVLPYPYARGHLRVRDGAGLRTLLWFDDHSFCKRRGLIVKKQSPGRKIPGMTFCAVRPMRICLIKRALGRNPWTIRCVC